MKHVRTLSRNPFPGPSPNVSSLIPSYSLLLQSCLDASFGMVYEQLRQKAFCRGGAGGRHRGQQTPRAGMVVTHQKGVPGEGGEGPGGGRAAASPDGEEESSFAVEGGGGGAVSAGLAEAQGLGERESFTQVWIGFRFLEALDFGFWDVGFSVGRNFLLGWVLTFGISCSDFETWISVFQMMCFLLVFQTLFLCSALSASVFNLPMKNLTKTMPFSQPSRCWQRLSPRPSWL